MRFTSSNGLESSLRLRFWAVCIAAGGSTCTLLACASVLSLPDQNPSASADAGADAALFGPPIDSNDPSPVGVQAFPRDVCDRGWHRSTVGTGAALGFGVMPSGEERAVFRNDSGLQHYSSTAGVTPVPDIGSTYPDIAQFSPDGTVWFAFQTAGSASSLVHLANGQVTRDTPYFAKILSIQFDRRGGVHVLSLQDGRVALAVRDEKAAWSYDFVNGLLAGDAEMALDGKDDPKIAVGAGPNGMWFAGTRGKVTWSFTSLEPWSFSAKPAMTIYPDGVWHLFGPGTSGGGLNEVIFDGASVAGRSVSDPSGSGNAVVAALDSAGAVHLAYDRFLYVDDTSYEAIIYATNQSGAWTKHLVDFLSSAGDGIGAAGVQLGIDAQGKAHLAYQLRPLTSNDASLVVAHPCD